MTGRKSVRELLKELLDLTTVFPKGGFMVGDMKATINGRPSFYGFPVIYGEAQFLPDGIRYFNVMSNTYRDIIRSDSDFKDMDSRISDKDWGNILKKSYADSLVDFKLEEINQAIKVSEFIDPEEFYQELTKKIKLNVSQSQYPTQYVFGCHLSNKSMKPLAIGPVLFETRNDWLERIDRMDKSIIDTSLIRAEWEDQDTDIISDKNHDSVEFLKTIGDANYVCTVNLKRSSSSETGRYIALKSARLALATIALGFNTPSRALNEMYLNWDERSTSRQLFLIGEYGNGYETNSQQYPGGIKHLSLDKWENLLEEMSNIFEASGRIITWFVNGADENSEQERELFHALLWFYQGCKEEDVHLAIHNFMSSRNYSAPL